jgi:hypothetical protein
MKVLEGRQEIAKALNFGKYPVIIIDKKNSIEMCGKIVGYRGGKVRVPWQYRGETSYIDCDVNYWIDESEITFSNGGAMISARFGYKELIEMAQNANTPILDKNQEFVLIVHNSEDKTARCPAILTTDNYKDIHCQSVLKVSEKLFI